MKHERNPVIVVSNVRLTPDWHPGYKKRTLSPKHPHPNLLARAGEGQIMQLADT